VTGAGFPEQGRPAAEVIAEIKAGRGDDADWRGGRTFSLVYNPADPELEELQAAVAHEYLHENYLNPFAFPSLLHMEQQLVGQAAALFGRPDAVGKLTSGGTESIFLAVQVAREHAREERGVAEPQLVTATTAHPAFAKAAHYSMSTTCSSRWAPTVDSTRRPRLPRSRTARPCSWARPPATPTA
jgi:glutamate/tyrosine decarboxylase-like PLP-dependent enzyme